MTTEIAETKWNEFCRRLAKACYGSMVSIELAQPDGSRTNIAENVPLLSLALDDRSDPCNNRIVIEAGAPDEHPVRHEVLEPIHVRLKRDREGRRYNEVHLLAENGITVLTLHPGVSPRVVKGLEVMSATSANRKAGPGPRSARQSSMRVSSEIPGAEASVGRATRKAAGKALANLDVDYGQGNLGRSRRQAVAPRSKRQRR